MCIIGQENITGSVFYWYLSTDLLSFGIWIFTPYQKDQKIWGPPRLDFGQHVHCTSSQMSCRFLVKEEGPQPQCSIKQIFVKYVYFRNPISLKRKRFVFTITQLSTFSGARQALFLVTTFPATLKTRSLLLLATAVYLQYFCSKVGNYNDENGMIIAMTNWLW